MPRYADGVLLLPPVRRYSSSRFITPCHRHSLRLLFALPPADFSALLMSRHGCRFAYARRRGIAFDTARC